MMSQTMQCAHAPNGRHEKNTSIVCPIDHLTWAWILKNKTLSSRNKTLFYFNNKKIKLNKLVYLQNNKCESRGSTSFPFKGPPLVRISLFLPSGCERHLYVIMRILLHCIGNGQPTEFEENNRLICKKKFFLMHARSCFWTFGSGNAQIGRWRNICVINCLLASIRFSKLC